MGHRPLNRLLGRIRYLVSKPADQGGTDGALLRRFVGDRDQGAFAALVHRHGPLVLGVCRRVLHDSCQVEDAFQATFVVLAQSAGSLRRRDSIAGWLHRVAYQTAARVRSAQPSSGVA